MLTLSSDTTNYRSKAYQMGPIDRSIGAQVKLEWRHNGLRRRVGTSCRSYYHKDPHHTDEETKCQRVVVGQNLGVSKDLKHKQQIVKKSIKKIN